MHGLDRTFFFLYIPSFPNINKSMHVSRDVCMYVQYKVTT
jgi:hypothetical protein